MVWNLLNRDESSSRSVYVNFTAIGIFVALAAAAAAGVHVLHARQVARHTPLVLEEAKKRAAAGELPSALAYYQTYLGYRPTDAEAIAEHALIKAKLAQGPQSAADAFYSLMRALNKLPDRDDVRRELVRLAVRLGRLRDCPDELDKLLDQAPNDQEVLELAALGAVQLRQFDAARIRFEKLLELGTDNPQTYVDLIRLLSVELKDYAAADDVMARLLKLHPDERELRTMAAAYYFRRGQLDLAEEQIRVAMRELQATDPVLDRLQVEIARQRRRPLELEASLARLAEQKKGDRPTELALAETELSLGRRKTAHERLLRVANDDEARPEEIWRVITVLSAAGFEEDEAPLRARLRRRDSTGIYVDSLQMLDRMRRGEWTAALELSRPILKAQDVPSQFITTISLWRAECYENLGDDENQAISLRRAIAADPDFLPAHSQLAQLLFRTGKIKEAQTEYAWLMAQSPAYAREFVTELLLAQSPEARFPLSSAEVDRLFERWRESAPNDPLPLLCQLDYFQRHGDDDKVAPLIDEGIRNWPKEVGFRIARADVILRARNWDEAWAFLEDAERNCGLHASLLVRKIACIEGVDPAEQPAKLITCAQQFANLDRDGQAFVLPILMRGLQRAGVDLNVVKQILAEYGDQNPGDVLARLTLFQLAVGGGDMESARRHLETLQETLGGESPAYKLAALLCDVKAATLGDAEARSRARTALGSMQDAYPDLAPQWFTLKADLDLSEQKPLKALESLQSALQSGDRRVATLTRTVSLMVLNGRLEQTVPYLKSFVESNAASLEKEGSSADDAPFDQRTDGEARAATSILPRRFDMSDLRAALEPAAASWPVALVVFRIDLELEQPDRAAEMIQKALAAAPGNPLVWANWLAYVEQHRPDRLQEELREAESKLSVADRARVLSSVLLRTNRFEDAERLLKAATQSDPRDPALFRARVRLMRQKPGGEDVEALLRETLAGRDEALAPVREVARRELARLLATQKDYRRFREAVDLSAEIAADADPADVEAWLIRAEVCQAHLGHWSDAVAAYRKIQNVAEAPVRMEAFSQEAKIHEQRRHWDDEAKALSELRALSPDGAQVVIRLLLNAVRRHDRAAAQALRQEVASASDDRTIGLMCDVFLATLSDDRSDVVSKVSAALEAKEIGLDAAFDWLALLKATDKCEAVLQQQIDPKKPETVAKYALFLAAHERLPDALVQLSQLWKSGARDAAIYVATGMTSMKEVAPDDLKPLRSTVLKLAAPDDAPTRMLIAAATLEDHAGRHAEAVSFYRRALLREPENVMALNNAAFLEAVSDFASDDGRLELVRRAIELVGPIDQLLDTEGVVLLRTGDALSALEKFQQAYEQRAEPNYLIHLAWALAELEQWDAAAEAYRKADASEPAPRLHPLEKLLDAAWRQRVQEHEKSADAAPQ